MPGVLRKTFAALAMLAALAATSAFAQQGGQARFAFVIGNDLYQDAPLPTAANDAGLIADTLTSAGFDVTGARNLDQDTLRSSYREFLEKVAEAGPQAIAFVYLSGYGVQFEGENYLVPAGAQVARDSDIPLNAVRLSDLTKALAGLGAGAKIVVFDLAHPYPPASAPGLALIDPNPGMLVAMNAAPGTVAPAESGPYSAYAQALAEMIGNPGMPLAGVFDQARLRVAALTNGAEVPWDESRIEQPFVFFAAAPGAPPPEVTAADVQARITRPIRDFPADQAYAAALERDTLQGYEDFLVVYPTSPYARTVRGLLAARREALTWRHTLDAGSAEAYWSYLRRYPKGPHATEARQILGMLAAAVQPPPDFAPLDYDVPPPPSVEVVYFDAPQPFFYDPDYAPPPLPVVFLPPPPPWWVLPPPRRIEQENVYFLPGVEHREEPSWRRPPPYVVPPPQPVYEHGGPPPGQRITPYVAIPAALAAGIAAGRLMKGSSGTPEKANLPGQPPQKPVLLPPVTAPPKHTGPSSLLPPAGGPTLPGGGHPNQPPSHPSAGLPPGGQPLPGAGGSNPPSGRPNNQPPGHPAAGLPPGSQPLPGAGGSNPPSGRLNNQLPSHPAAGLPPGGPTLPGAGGSNPPSGHPNNQPPGHPAAGLPPGGQPLPGAGGRTLPRNESVTEPRPPSSPSLLRETKPAPEHNAPPPPRIAEPSPPPHAAPPHPQPELRTAAPPPQPHIASPPPPPPQPHLSPPPQQVRQAPPPPPPPQHPAGNPPPKQDCGHPGQPACK